MSRAAVNDAFIWVPLAEAVDCRQAEDCIADAPQCLNDMDGHFGRSLAGRVAFPANLIFRLFPSMVTTRVVASLCGFQVDSVPAVAYVCG
jgi:hypothetical protein